MLYLRKLMLPIDFSEASYTASLWALKWGHMLGAKEVHLIHVLVFNPAASLYQASLSKEDVYRLKEEVPATFRENWASLKREASALGYQVRTDILQATSVVPPLNKYAEDHEIDLMVLNTHGRSGFKAQVLGSVARDLLHTAPCPVMITRVPNHTLVSVQPIEKILVPIDYSDRAKEATRLAREIAFRAQAEITAFHVAEMGHDPLSNHSEWERDYDQSHPLHLQTPKLTAFLHEAAGARVISHTAPLYGEPIQATLSYLAHFPHDLIVIGTHENPPQEFAFNKSITERLVNLSPCPVMSFRPSSRSLMMYHLDKPLEEAEEAMEDF